MALINGTNYDHIDLKSAPGGNMTRHKLQDTDGRALVAPTEASSTAGAAHAKGSYFIFGGALCQATADIAQGGSIVTGGSGQNCSIVADGIAGEVYKYGSKFISTQSVDSFGIADLPRNAYTQSTASKFTDKPSDIADSMPILIIRRPMNGGGNVSIISVYERAGSNAHAYFGMYTESTGFEGWTKLANSVDIDILQSNAGCNCTDLLARYTIPKSGTASNKGVDRTWNGGACTLSGTPSDITLEHIFYVDRYAMPGGFTPGATYYIKFDGSANVKLRVRQFVDGEEAAWDEYAGDAEFTVLDGVNGMQITIAIYTGAALDITVHPVILNAKTNMEIGDKLVEPSVFVAETSNLFDRNAPNLLNGYFGHSAAAITGNENTKTLYVPCEPNTDYVISRATGFYAGIAGSASGKPTVGGGITPLAGLEDATVDGVYYLHVKTGANARYLAYYFYNDNNHDTPGAYLTYMQNIMISKGTEYRAYRPHQSAFVKYPELAPVNPYGIFGVKFKRGAANPAMMRTYDAAGMTYRQQTGTAVERSDFDRVFPWCEMRECNVTVDGNGVKTVVYRGETGFSRAANTYIEIPAFYFKRTVVSGVEEWAVSGKPFSGADVEPWFVNSDGSIAKYRYIGKYEGCALDGGSMSVSGAQPKTRVSVSDIQTYLETYGAKLMSFEAFLALSHLMVIECCTFDLQKINVGVSYLPYSVSSSGWNKAQNSGTGNTVVLSHSASDERLNYLNVGDTIYLSETKWNDVSNPRTVTAFSIDSDTQVTIQFDGNPYTVTANTTYCFPAMQFTGRTDSMTYHTGRPLTNPMNSPFQYRGVENPYGNAWTLVDGITWAKDTGKFTLGENGATAFTAPYQTATGSDGTTKGWITKLGYDRAMPWATIVETVLGEINVNGIDRYITDEWNTIDLGEYESINVRGISVGGGWDHQGENGMFCLRASAYDGSNWLYGYRAMID